MTAKTLFPKKIDPSRYTVYETLRYLGKENNFDLVEKLTDNYYSMKTKPSIHALFNMTHILSNNFDENDLKNILKFYEGSDFRVKVSADSPVEDLLLYNNFKQKGGICADMKYVGKKLSKSDLVINSNLNLKKVSDEKSLKDYKFILSKGFNHDLSIIEKRFGFFDKTILESTNSRINAFVLYNGDIAVSTGSYFAFDYFSSENIATLEEHRGNRYASIIMTKLLLEAQEQNYKTICLSAEEGGINTYKRLGYEVVQKTKTFILK
ncbi:MAG: GNAT family N-acetyltransferase [Alphaproteobacteria bacterium]|nr:MAG: hypothetical protein B6I23_03390 [Rickettsiaceae bacterium 4572_127]